MSENAISMVVKQWLIEAEHDLDVAKIILKQKENIYTDAVCFHSQQAVEKFLKAYLVFK